MHDQPRQTLQQIVRSYGLSVLDDPRRCRALMMDFCGQFRGEINLVEMALREGVAEALQSAPPTMPMGLITARLAQGLQDAYYLPDGAAHWAVETIAAALDPQPEPEGRKRVLVTRVGATIHVRPWLAADEAWQIVGRTPGTVTLPVDGEVRISARLDDAAASELARDLKSIRGVHQLDLAYSPLTDEALELLTMEGLVALDLSRTRVGDLTLQRLGANPTLRTLNLWGVETISDRGVAALGAGKSLEDLELGRCPRVTDAGLVGLRCLSHAREVGLAATQISDEGLRWVGQLPALRALDLSATAITGRGLGYLDRLQVLTTLDLSGCVNLRADGLAGLRLMRALAELRLARCGMLTDSSLVHLRPLVGMRALNLEGLNITDASLLYLAGMTVLASLDLSWTPMSDRGLARLTDLRGLQSLSLSGTQITDAGLMSLAELPDLAYLDLSSTEITDTGLRNLRSVTTLEALDLESTGVRDAGLVHLGAMPSLARLFLGGTDVTDVGLELLSRITNLREIDLTLCPGVTQKGIELLRQGGVTVSH